MLVSLLLRLSGDFEAGVSKNGQSRENILLSYTLGVNRTTVAVNKMDEKTVNYSEKLHNEIKTQTGNFLKRTWFNLDKIHLSPSRASTATTRVRGRRTCRGTRPDAP